MNRPDRILIVAGDSDGNIGDRAILLSMCEAFIRLRPGLEIAIVSNDPGRDRRFFPGVKTILRGPRGMLALLEYARSSDLVLCGGGGLFQDDDSLVKMPYWAMRLLLLRLCCPRVVGYALGAGPLSTRVGRWSARLAFACMERITVRDREALRSCRALTSKSIELLPDPALATRAASQAEAASFLRTSGVPAGNRPLLGVALRRWFHRPDKAWIPHKYAYRCGLRRRSDHPDYQRLLTLLAEALDRVAAGCGAHILFLPTYNVAHESDDKTCREVMARMRCRDASVLTITDPRLYKAVAGQLSALLGGRMHPAILAASAGTPVVGLSYNQKFKGFFDLLARGDRVLDLESFVREEKTGELAELLIEAIRSSTTWNCPALATLNARIDSFNQALLAPAEA